MDNICECTKKIKALEKKLAELAKKVAPLEQALRSKR